MARRPRPVHRHESARLELPDDRPLRLAIVADTHGKPHASAHQLIAKEQPDAILHAGDIGSLSVLDELAALAPVVAVRGNIDGRGTLPDSVDVRVSAAGEECYCILLTHIALAGPRLRADAARLAARHGAALVVCGHSHIPFIGRDRGLSVFNPGSVGPRRFSLPIVFGLATLGASSVKVEHISCETGERWAP